MHAKSCAYNANKETVKRLNQHKKFLKKINAQITALLKSDKELYEKIKTVSSIKGVGIMTVTKVVAETAGFALIKNKNQITSYSGYDIIHDQSGTHNGKTKISKR